MKIILTDNYFIEHEPLNYTLKKAKTTYGKGKNKTDIPRTTIETIGYFGDVPHALEHFYDELIAEKTEDFVGNLDEYIARLKNIKQHTVDEISRKVGAKK